MRLLADYNRLMNARQYAVCARLDVEALNADCGAFFGSVLGTLNHLLVGDLLWLGRFSRHEAGLPLHDALSSMPRPQALDECLYPVFEALVPVRRHLDDVLCDWCASLGEADLELPLHYENARGEPFVRLLGDLLLHLFLHQVHHRGQVTTLLSQAGVDFGETDLVEIVPNLSDGLRG